MGVEPKFAAINTAVKVAEEAHTLMANLKQEVGRMQSPTSPLKPQNFQLGPYCKNIKDRSAKEELSRNKLTAVRETSDILHESTKNFFL